MSTKCPNCHSDNADTVKFCGECGTQLPSARTPRPEVTATLQTPGMELTTGSTFANRYQIIEELGHGGMGKVFKVFDKETNSKVALKLIKPEVAADKNTIERFRNELNVARGISHKHICRMYDLGRDADNYFITMEYVPGEDLKNMIRMSGQLGVGTAVKVAKQVCEGLSEAHKLEVVHRDLKPSNIMIDRKGNVRIMDFGIARSIKGQGITGAGVMIGTPEYMSPEQVEGKEVDHRSDIYSLGITLYEMLTGRVPFEGDTPFAVGVKHKSETPNNPRELNAQIPDDLSRLILKCLEKDKGKRYQAADEIYPELERIERGIPSAERAIQMARPLTSTEIAVKYSLKKIFIASAIVVAVIALVIVIWRLLPHKVAAPARPGRQSIAVLPFEDLSPAKDHEYLCKGIAETLINSLGKIKDLWVPARASSFSFEGKNLSLREIGQNLGVDNLLEASVQVIGKRFRITPKIINIKDGSLVWSDQYDRQMEDIFAIQDEIAQEIVKSLKIKLLGEKGIPLIKNYTRNVEAYQFYLKGLFLLDKRAGENFQKAIESFHQALEIDPNYALAQVGLADSYNLMALYYILSPKEAVPKAKAAALKALELDGQLAEAYASLASIRLFDWEWSKAEEEFKRAIELSPNYATAHLWYGGCLAQQGRFQEALREYEHAQKLDPVSLAIRGTVGYIFFLQGLYQQATEICKMIIESNPNFALAHATLARIYTQESLFSEAISEYQKAVEIHGGNWSYYAEMGHALAASGNKEAAQKCLARVLEKSKDSYIDGVKIALIYSGLGKDELACDWLEKAYEDHAYGLREIKLDPRFSKLRSNPRVLSILQKIGLDK